MDVIRELSRITQAVSMVSSPDRQVEIIVDEISRCLGMEVCSLYLVDSENSLRLIATHGLNANRPVNIPAGKGLVGLVAKNQHTINLSNGLKHPDYFHVEDIQEEKYKSFCGAPIVSHGQILGVLVVQGRSARQLSPKREAFLTTLASHIALIVKNLPKTDKIASVFGGLIGVSASDGVAIGSPVICDRASLTDVKVSSCENSEKELAVWRDLIAQVAKELENEKALLASSLSAELSEMFEAYRLLLLDKALSEHVETSINQGYALDFSLKLAIQHFSEMFKAIGDPYLQARSEDLWHIGNKIYQSHIDDHSLKDLFSSSESEIILVGYEVSVSDIALCPVGRLKGIVCVGGGRLSHTSILANALGIPAVMGVEGLFNNALGKRMIVDGTDGRVFPNPSAPILSEYCNAIIKQDDIEKSLSHLKDTPALTKNGSHIMLLANSGLLSDITPGLNKGAEGIGLFRTEIAFMSRETFPTEEDQVALYRDVLTKYKGKPVYMRTLDVGSDKQLPYFLITGEDNPAMGWRGIRFTLDNVQVLMTQLRAMLIAAGIDNELNIIVPMVSSFEELEAFKSVLSDAMLQLQHEGYEIDPPRIGVMIEVPASISQLRFWAEHIDFVSIGTNDLSQYLLALDRNNPKVSPRFDLVHPAVLAEVYRAVKQATEMSLPVCVCGEMASDPIAVLLLIAMGVKTLSVSAAKIPKLKSLILQVEEPTIADFLSYSLEQRTSKSIRTKGEDVIQCLAGND